MTSPATVVTSPRRYYLLRRHAVSDEDIEDIATTWRAKQEAQPGTALPSDFPFLSELDAAGYYAEEDLDGASVEELVSLAGLSRSDAAAVLSAYAEL